MKLSELPDDFTDEQFMRLDKEGLDEVPYTRMRWLCQCKGCMNGTHVRDYGLEAHYFLDRNSKAAAQNPSNYWMGLGNYWLCSKHNKLFKRLEKSFELEHIFNKLIDWTKAVRVPIEGSGLDTVRKIEQKPTP